MQVIRYTPSFVDLEDEDYLPVEVKNFEDIVCLEWVNRWPRMVVKGLEFRGWMHSLDRFGAHQNEACLWAMVYDGRNERAMLVAFVSHAKLVSHLPEYKHVT